MSSFYAEDGVPGALPRWGGQTYIYALCARGDDHWRGDQAATASVRCIVRRVIYVAALCSGMHATGGGHIRQSARPSELACLLSSAYRLSRPLLNGIFCTLCAAPRLLLVVRLAFVRGASASNLEKCCNPPRKSGLLQAALSGCCGCCFRCWWSLCTHEYSCMCSVHLSVFMWKMCMRGAHQQQQQQKQLWSNTITSRLNNNCNKYRNGRKTNAQQK